MAAANKLTNRDVGQLIHDYKHGRPVAEIAAELGVTKSVIHYHLHKRGIEQRQPHQQHTTGRRPAGTPYQPPTPASHDGVNGWVEDAACREGDPEVFFPGKGEGSNAGKRICRHCPVVAQCLAWALEHGEYGVWGGMSERERTRLLRKRQEAA